METHGQSCLKGKGFFAFRALSQVRSADMPTRRFAYPADPIALLPSFSSQPFKARCPRPLQGSSPSGISISFPSSASPFPRSLVVMPAENPFEPYESILSKTPWESPYLLSPWQQVMSYAWLIFLHASEYSEAHKLACEWARAFVSAFTPAYISLVLPAVDQPQTLKRADYLVNHLISLHVDIELMHEAAAIVEQLVSLSNPA